MSTLAEIEKAADALSQEEKGRLILFLAARLRSRHTERPHYPWQGLTRSLLTYRFICESGLYGLGNGEC
jgi:hypothetical protein